MTLTKQDMNEIKGTIDGSLKGFEVKIGQKIDDKIDDFARVVAKSFEQVATKMDVAGLKNDIARLELEIAEVKERVIYIERDTAEIRKSLISRMEMEDIMARLLLVEKKLGIKSGK